MTNTTVGSGNGNGMMMMMMTGMGNNNSPPSTNGGGAFTSSHVIQLTKQIFQQLPLTIQSLLTENDLRFIYNLYYEMMYNTVNDYRELQTILLVNEYHTILMNMLHPISKQILIEKEEKHKIVTVVGYSNIGKTQLIQQSLQSIMSSLELTNTTNDNHTNTNRMNNPNNPNNALLGKLIVFPYDLSPTVLMTSTNHATNSGNGVYNSQISSIDYLLDYYHTIMYHLSSLLTPFNLRNYYYLSIPFHGLNGSLFASQCLPMIQSLLSSHYSQHTVKIIS